MPPIAEVSIAEGPQAPLAVQTIADEEIEAYVDEMICKPGLTDYVPMSPYQDPDFEPDWPAFLALAAQAEKITTDGIRFDADADDYAADQQYRQDCARGWW